jgi:8-oxo-dGTP pyrophosphatase MutT (NUDIX family)
MRLKHNNMHEPSQGPLWRLVRRLFHFYWRFSRGMTLGVRAVVLSPEGEVFLVRHSYTPGWHLPGGGVEPGQTLVDALAAELAEEGNILLDGPPALHGFFLNRSASRRDHVAVFVVRGFSVIGPRAADAEILEARFFPLAALPAGTTPGTQRRIAEAVDGAAPTPYW